jgi:hypothetical protein
MAQPFNYTIQAPSAFESLVSGLRLGTSLEEMRLQQEQRAAQVAQAQQKAMQEQQQQMRLQEIHGKVNAGNATRGDWIELGDLSRSEATRKGVWETIGRMDEDKVNARVGIAQQFGFGLLKNADLTKKLMDDYLEANQNDPEIKRIRELADMDAQFAGNALLASLPGMGKQGMDAYGKIVDRLFPEAEKPAAEPEKIRILRAAGLEPTLENIGKLAAAERAPNADIAVMDVLGLPKTEAGFARLNELRQSGRGPLVQNILPGEPGGKAALEKLDVPRAAEFSQNASAARTFAQYSKTIADLLRGRGSGAVVKLTTNLMSELGLSSSTVSARDLADSLAVRGATLVRVPGSGSTTDLEFKAYLSAFPSLKSSEAGREIMAKYADAIASRNAKLADYARKLIRADNFSEEEMARFDNSLGPILGKDFYDAIGGKKPERANQRKPASQLSNEELLRQLEGK